jgi:uncharacterized membrane protein
MLMSQWKLGTNVSKLREQASDGYKSVGRFLFVTRILAIISAIGLSLGLGELYPPAHQWKAIPFVVAAWIYTWVLYSVLKFVKLLVDIAVNSKVNEELLKENTDYLRQLVEIEKFKLKRSGQMPSEYP